MELKLIKSLKYIVLFFLISITSCSKKSIYKIDDVKIIMDRNHPQPDVLIYTLITKNDTIIKNNIDYINIIDNNNTVIEKRYSFKLLNNNTKFRIRTTKFIDSFNDSIELKKYLLTGKVKIVYLDGKEKLYRSAR